MRRENLARRLRKAAWPLALLAAFLLGLWLAGDEPHQHDAPASSTSQGQVWTCSMHPQIRNPEPGQCPICGMDLVPVGSDQAEADPNRITLSPAAKQLARIRTVEVVRQGKATSPLELLGRIEAAETQVRTVTARAGGRIDKLHVNVTGQQVRKGQAIATLYSPELYAASRDLELAAQQVRALAKAAPSAKSAAQAALTSARRRLQLLGVPSHAIDDIAAGNGRGEHVAIYSPYAGTVTERLVSEGQYVEPGTPLYRLVDLETLWVQLDAYESDLPHLQVGQKVKLEVTATPGRERTGTVVFVDPVVDPARRTARVRVELPNPKGELKPGMFARAVVLRDEKGSPQPEAPLVIPRSAPLFTGKRAVVYVEIPHAEQPTYEAREVRLGAQLGDLYPVVAGLQAGERVVAHGAFALDADLQIRGGNSMMNRGDDLELQAQPAPVELTDAQRNALAPVLRAYLEVQHQLAEDELERAQAAGRTLAQAAAEAKVEPELEGWPDLAPHLQKQGRALAAAEDLASARRIFEPLSESVLGLLARYGNPTEVDLRVVTCPMAINNRPATWVQEQAQVHNSYQGEAMRQCGEVKRTLAPREHMPRDGQTASPPTRGHQH